MMRQYELIRQEFLKELEEILVHFRIHVRVEGKAAWKRKKEVYGIAMLSDALSDSVLG